VDHGLTLNDQSFIFNYMEYYNISENYSFYLMYLLYLLQGSSNLITSFLILYNQRRECSFPFNAPTMLQLAFAIDQLPLARQDAL